MKKIYPYFILLIAMTSCNHYYYIQPTHNVPLFKEKDEFRASISFGKGDETSTVDMQAAYAISDKFALMTNYMLAWGEGGYIDSLDMGKGQYIDAAFGYFKPIGKHGVFEIFQGLGSSQQHHEYFFEGTSDLSFTKVFIQPSIGLTYNAIDVAFTSGFSNINFYKVNNQITNPNGSEYASVDLISKNKNAFLFEPSLTLRGGKNRVKLQVQAGFSQNLSNTNLAFETFKLSGGITFAFGQRFVKKNTGT
jgi:hypothetical protein